MSDRGVRTFKRILIATLVGAASGALAAATLAMMGALSGLLWRGEATSPRIFITVLIGGAMIAALRLLDPDDPSDPEAPSDLDAQIRAVSDEKPLRQRRILLIAASATIAVAFGGAVGPEAGILALAAELSALVALILRADPDAEDRRLAGEASAAGALSGLYLSPPGGAVYAEREAETQERAAPRALLFLAGVAGVAAFLLAAKMLLRDVHLRIELPLPEQTPSGLDMLGAVAPALFGGLAGLAFAFARPRLAALLARVGTPPVQTLVGTLAFAALAAASPLTRFSGHHEIGEMLDFAATAGAAPLVGLSLAKAVALALCLAAGWRGGAVFPLFFVGAAAAASAVALVPGSSPSALVAGMAAAAAVGIGKPLAATLIAALLIAPFAPGPLCVGAIVGFGLAKLAPPPPAH